MLKIMRVLSMGLVATLLLIGHVQASGGGGGSFTNPLQDDGPLGNKQSSRIDTDPWGDMFAEFDGPSKNLEQALYKVKYKGKFLTEDQRRRYYDALSSNTLFPRVVEEIGLDDALYHIIDVEGPDATISNINKFVNFQYGFLVQD